MYFTLYGVRGVAGSNFQHARSDKCPPWTKATDSVITIGCGDIDLVTLS